jgi:formate hydrogenlyase transcriptional activator
MQLYANPPSFSSEQDAYLISLAAMFEAEFSIDWLEELTGMKASAILAVLEDETQKGVLIGKRPAIYLFARPQKRQELIGRLSDEEKDRYCRNIAAILVRELPEDDTKSLEIARYLLRISNGWKGCQWLVRAGEVYMESFRTEDATRCFEKVLSDLSEQRGDDEDWLFVKAAIEYSNITTGKSNTIETLSLLRDAKVRAKRIEPLYEILLEMHIAKHEWLSSHHNKALKRFEEAFSRIENLRDPDLLAAATDLSNYFLFWQGRFRDVIETYERSLPDVERYPSGVFPITAAIIVGRSYAMTGQFTQGLGMLHTVYERCVEKGDLFLASHASSAIGTLMLSINHLDDAFRYFRSSLNEAKQSQNYYVKLIVTFMLALAHHRKGENKQSLSYLRTFLKDSREINQSLQVHPYLMEICWAMELGDFPRVPDLSLEQEIREMLSVRNILSRGIAYRYQALLGKKKGWSNQRVIRSLNLSARLIGDSGHLIEYAKTQLELARYYLTTGEVKKVRRLVRLASEVLSTTNMELIPDDLIAFVRNPNRERSVLREILELRTEMLAETQDKKQLLQQIVAAVNRITGAERGAILLIDGDSAPGLLHVRSSKNLTPEQVEHVNFASSRKMIQDVAATGRGRIFEIASSEQPGTNYGEIVRSGICVPLFLGGRTVGVLYHDNRLLGNVFKESDLVLLEYFAALIALDLDSAKARKEVQEFREKNHAKEVTVEKEYEQTSTSNGIIGRSPAMKRVLAEMARVAKTDTAVLILGETGVGKNLVASVIHDGSARSGGPFVSVHCSALTESLITSELFGHEKGAFTGATNRRIGRFEMADKGTLFLDEIGDLTLDVQARLLRVLQSKEFERVGGGKETLTSDFRLVAATNRNLEEDIRASRFREDLYYRINVFPLCVPPLRERKEDIPLLFRHFLKLYAARSQHAIDDIPKEVMERLVNYDWPGNIREMENIVQRGIILGHGRRFQLPELGVAQFRTDQTNGAAGTFNTLEENERQHILEALKRSRWKIHGTEGAAEMLRINPSTLASRMKKLGIRKPERRDAGRME